MAAVEASFRADQCRPAVLAAAAASLLVAPPASKAVASVYLYQVYLCSFCSSQCDGLDRLELRQNPVPLLRRKFITGVSPWGLTNSGRPSRARMPHVQITIVHYYRVLEGLRRH